MPCWTGKPHLIKLYVYLLLHIFTSMFCGLMFLVALIWELLGEYILFSLFGSEFYSRCSCCLLHKYCADCQHLLLLQAAEHFFFVRPACANLHCLIRPNLALQSTVEGCISLCRQPNMSKLHCTVQVWIKANTGNQSDLLWSKLGYVSFAFLSYWLLSVFHLLLSTFCFCGCVAGLVPGIPSLFSLVDLESIYILSFPYDIIYL